MLLPVAVHFLDGLRAGSSPLGSCADTWLWGTAGGLSLSLSRAACPEPLGHLVSGDPSAPSHLCGAPWLVGLAHPAKSLAPRPPRARGAEPSQGGWAGAAQELVDSAEAMWTGHSAVPTGGSILH